MLEICQSGGNDIDVSGTAKELLAVRRGIIDLTLKGETQIVFDANPFIDPKPYDAVVQRMIIRKGQGAIKVSLVNAEEMLVDGSVENLEAFASFFNFELNATVGCHSHFEHYDGNECVAHDSIPLVISIK